MFFENAQCETCGSSLGFEPQQQRLHALECDGRDGAVSISTGEKFMRCGLQQELGCNWLISRQDNNSQCLSCRTTHIIPTLTLPKNHLRWERLEQTKRRAFYMLFRLGLPLKSLIAGTAEMPPLQFDFLEDRRSNPEVMDDFIYSGHRHGVITVNAAEADDSFRAANRELMNELYRTLLGHFRHELGHYCWLLLTENDLVEFRRFFGDEREDYQTALDRYYNEGVHADWREFYISAYASSHPMEDWAETWAHYLHIADTLETAKAYGVIAKDCSHEGFERMLTYWAELTVALNALNRSMGVDDAYPFIITSTVIKKLCFIDRLVTVWRTYGHNAATS